MKKNRDQKSRATVPLNMFVFFFMSPFQELSLYFQYTLQICHYITAITFLRLYQSRSFDS
jgi:hypothetical protein